MPLYFIGDRVKVVKDIYYKDLYPHNFGRRGDSLILTKGLVGKVVDVHQEGGDEYPFICVDFTVSKVTGSWYLHVNDIEGE